MSGTYNNPNLCLTPGDRDWFIFSRDLQYYFFLIEGYNSSVEGAYGLDFVLSQNTVTIETYETGGSTDTKIRLYNEGGEELAFNDDGSAGYFSLINYTFPPSESRSEQTTSVEDDFIEETFSIFPNPTEGKFTIVMIKNIGNEDLILEIMDAAGRIMVQKEIHTMGDEYRDDFDLSDQPAGMYFINLKGKDLRKVGKVVVW